MEFPTPWTVQVQAYDSTAEDGFGNPLDAWGPAGAPQPVYGWCPPGTIGRREVTGWRSVVTTDVELLAPPGFTCNPRDRIILDGLVHEVQGEVEDFNHGPFGFRPGVVVNLKRTKGST